MGLSLALLSHNYFVEEPATASAFAIVSNSHPDDLPDSYCLDYELIQLVMKEQACLFYFICPNSIVDLVNQY